MTKSILLTVALFITGVSGVQVPAPSATKNFKDDLHLSKDRSFSFCSSALKTVEEASAAVRVATGNDEIEV
jgi:hypothetical protein